VRKVFVDATARRRAAEARGCCRSGCSMAVASVAHSFTKFSSRPSGPQAAVSQELVSAMSVAGGIAGRAVMMRLTAGKRWDVHRDPPQLPPSSTHSASSSDVACASPGLPSSTRCTSTAARGLTSFSSSSPGGEGDNRSGALTAEAVTAGAPRAAAASASTRCLDGGDVSADALTRSNAARKAW